MRLPLVIAIICITTACASSGDRSDVFQRCLNKCARQSCTATATDDGNLSPTRAQQGQQAMMMPLALRLTRWTCADNCKYTCMHALTDLAEESGVRMEQYYGKWPFWRYAGMQEPASVAFSVANLLMHVLGADWLRRGVHPLHPMRPFYRTWAYVSINAWVWSAVFHTRGAYPSHLFLFTSPYAPFNNNPPFTSFHSLYIRYTPPGRSSEVPFLENHPFVPSDDGQETCFQLTDLRRALGALRICIQTRH